MPASELLPNPKNWRTHGEQQRNVVRGLLAEVGYADAVLARELQDGQLMLIDGHLRVEETPDAEVPVLLLDVNEAEADLLLASLDPSAALAETDAVKLTELLREINTGSEALGAMLSDLAFPATAATVRAPDPEGAPSYDEQFGVVVICTDEDHQREVYEALEADGYKCKVVCT